MTRLVLDRAGSSLFFLEPSQAYFFRARAEPGHEIFASSQYEPENLETEPISSLVILEILNIFGIVNIC